MENPVVDWAILACEIEMLILGENSNDEELWLVLLLNGLAAYEKLEEEGGGG